ncbi:MAG: rRNA maturation RNase YbeY [Minisyncoccia bacterium]
MRDVCRYHHGIDKNKILRAVNLVVPKSKTIREFGLVFVSPQKMAELNLKYRRQNKPTNILSFAGLSRELGSGDPFKSVQGRPEWSRTGDPFKSVQGRPERSRTGDVVVCPKVAVAEAKKYGFTQKNWMTRLIVHAILHLAGYDHKTQRAELEMERLENKTCEKLGVLI